MDTRQLTYFVTLTECRSFAKAAQKLYISKQGLSKSIATLEDELHQQLFIRNANGVSLTPAGEILLRKSEVILGSYMELVDELNACPTQEEFRVVYSKGFFSVFPLHIVTKFFEGQTYLRLRLISTDDYNLERRFSEDNCDVGFCTNPIQNGNYQYTHLFTNHRVLLVSPDHPFARKGVVSIHDLKDITVAAPSPGYFDVDFLTKQCHDAGFEPKLFPLSDNTLIKEFAKSADGASLYVTSIDRVSHSDGLVQVFFEENNSFAYEVNLIEDRRSKRSPLRKQFVQYLTDACKTLERPLVLPKAGG